MKDDTVTRYVLSDGKITGGTGQAIRIAIDLKIPVFNMGEDSWDSALNHEIMAILAA